MTFANPFYDGPYTTAAVSVVLPGLVRPTDPALTYGLVRKNFSLAMTGSLSFDFDQVVFSVALDLRDDLFLDRRRHRRIVRKLHCGCSASLGHRSQVGNVAEHRCQWHFSVDCLLGRAPRHS